MAKVTVQLMATNFAKVKINDEHELPKADVNDALSETCALKARVPCAGKNVYASHRHTMVSDQDTGNDVGF